MPLPSKAPAQYTSSKQLIAGSDFNALSSQTNSAQSLTASVTQTQASAIANATLNAAAVKVTTGNANDAVALPKGFAGAQVFVYNSSANALQVFPQVGDSIN